jgi:hypothetical protein
MAKILARWHEETFHLAGQPVKLKVKAPSFAEAPEFLARMEAIGKAAIEQNMAAVFSAENAQFALESFGRFVKPGEELQDEDGKPLVTGADVFGLGNPGFVLDVLRSIQRYSMLTASEGKGSGSPSTSPVAAGASGDSPAPSTAGEASASV